MKVVIASAPRPTQPMGLGLAERHLIEAVRRRAPKPSVDVRVVGGRAGRRYARAIGAQWIPSLPGHAPRRAWKSADLIHLLALDFPPPSDVPFVLSIQDVAGMHFPDEAQFPEWTGDAVTRAARVITASSFSAGELESVLGVGREKIRIVTNGPGHPMSVDTPPASDDELRAIGVTRPYVIRMGGYSERKNVPMLLRAWPDVHRQTGAVLVMTGSTHPAAQAQLAEASSLPGVVLLDYVAAPMLQRLLRTASALVSTSTYEGFGLPPLEAMRAGVPVVAVRAGAVEEVCDDAAFLVDNDIGALRDGLTRVLEDRALRDQLVARGLSRCEAFSWTRAAGELLDVYCEIERQWARGAA